MIERFINFVIRPPRAEYNPDQYLWESEFSVAGRKFKRKDFELPNGRGHILMCSHYVPAVFPGNTHLPCVIYCHGNSGCRADANEAAAMLLPSNITVFTLDFSGSGLSDGDYVSLGWHEKEDLKTVVSFLRENKQISRIGLWGRSMGAVTSLLYGAEDPSIAGMVLDSAFANLHSLMMELVDVYRIRLPKFTIRLGLQYMRRVIQKKAKFDIMELNAVQGDKNIIKFDGDHNSPRPQFYHDSLCIFFYNVLHPPQVPSTISSKLEKYYDLGDLKIGAGMDESLLYEIIAGLRAVTTGSSDASSSSSVPPSFPRGPTTTSVTELLSEVGMMTNNDDALLVQEKIMNEITSNEEEAFHMQDNEPIQSDECCSYSSSNRESWGRCSSIGVSEEEPSSMECTTSSRTQILRSQISLRLLATPLRRIQRKVNDPSKEKKIPSSTYRKLEKLGMLGQRLRHSILKRVGHKRHSSPRPLT